MPKKRKTRKEKILHDNKKHAIHESQSPVVSSPKTDTTQEQESTTAGMTFSLPATQEKNTQPPQKAKQASQTVIVSQNEYSYLSNDLMRTALLTGAIVFTELVIKLFIAH